MQKTVEIYTDGSCLGNPGPGGYGIFMIYNANNSSEYTFMTTESTNRDESGKNYGSPGGIVFTVTSAVDGVYFAFNSGNIASGTFTLYKVT